MAFFFDGEGNGTPLQYSCLEKPMDGGAWWAAVHAVEKSRTRLSDFTFTSHFYALEKEMATHSSVLAWRIPGMGSHRVGHDWSDLQFFFEGLAMFKVYFSHWCFLGSLGAFLLQPFGSTLALVFWLSTSPVFWLLESSFSSPEQWFLYLTFQ